MSIPGSASPLFFQTAAADAAAAGPTKSLRFNHSDSAYLERNFGSAGNQRTFTISLWFKNTLRSNGQRTFFTAQENSPFKDKFTKLWLSSNHTLHFDERDGGSDIWELNSSAVFTDPSAWYHLVARVDTTQSTAADRVRLYVNGTQITDFSSAVYPSQNALVKFVNVNNAKNFIGRYLDNSYEYLDAYVADFYFIDGLSLDPTSFGAYDSNNVWQVATYSGTFGTNGYHLAFSDSSSNAAIGTDSSGNSNTFTVNNLFAATAAAKDYSTGQVTGSESGFVSGYGPDKMFDGSLSTVTDQVDTGNTGEAGYLYWNPSTAISVSSKLRIYGRWYVSSINNQYLISDEVSINGNSYTAPGDGTTSNQWVDLSSYLSSNSITSITNITFRSNPTSGNRLDPGIAAIEVDDTILVNSAATDGDVMFDVPANGTQSDTGAGGEVSGNYPTLNPLSTPSTTTLSNGNLEYTNSARDLARSTIATPQSGKWYFEAEVTGETTGGGDHGVGLIVASESDLTAGYVGQLSTAYGYYGDGNKYNNSSGSSYGSSFGPGDIIGCAFDADGGNLYFYKNGVAQNSGTAAFTGLTDQYFFAIENGTGGTMRVNFGAKSFAYNAPSGYKTLCTTNLPTPTIANSSEHFEAILYTGNGGTQTISGLGFSPDFVWIKKRGSQSSHHWNDTVRGTQKTLSSNYFGQENWAGGGSALGELTAFTSDGYTLVNSGSYGFNDNNDNYVAWNWDAGSSTASNTDGSITAQVRASQTSGFSVVTYTGNGSSSATVGHGLNAVPDLIIHKRRNGDAVWNIKHSSLSSNHNLEFSTSAQGNVTSYSSGGLANLTSSSTFGFTSGSSGVNNVNASGGTYVCYVFSAVAGFSAFGSYEGNGSTSQGPYIYTGFAPAFLMFRRYNSTGDWIIFDNKRNTHAGNYRERVLYAHNSNAEEDAANGDTHLFLSNGFAIDNVNFGYWNASGDDYLWVAFAENPFQANGGLAR